MALRESLVQIATVLGVLLGFGYLIISQMLKNNSKALEWLKKLKPGKVYLDQKIEPAKDKIEQVWDEKRTVM